MRAVLPAALLLLAALGAPAAAENLLTNTAFTVDTSSWTPVNTDTQVVWSPVDADASRESGSAKVLNVAAVAGVRAGIAQCVPALGGFGYDFGGKANVVAGAAEGSFGRIDVLFYPSAGCSGPSTAFTTGTTQRSEVWEQLSAKSATAPPGTQSASLVLASVKASGGGHLDVLFDSVLLLGPTLEKLTIPTSASIHGLAGTFFQTDLWVMNRSYTRTVTVYAAYRCFRSQTCSGDLRPLVLEPRSSTLLRDVVGTFFGAPESAGAIELTYQANVGEIAASARIYAPALPAPTTGTGVPALPASQARARAVFLGLSSSGGDLTKGFRSNAGVYNPNIFPVEVRFDLYEGDGSPVGGTFTRTWQGNEANQLTGIFAYVGAGAALTENAYLVVTASAPVFTWVTVIDNQTGDQVWVLPFDDEPAP